MHIAISIVLKFGNLVKVKILRGSHVLLGAYFG